MKEIERKFVTALEGEFDFSTIDSLLYVRQGYIMSRPSFEWRIRSMANLGREPERQRYFTALKIGNGFVRKEYECELPRWLFRPLMKLAGSRVVLKTRATAAGWDIDAFHGKLQGLTLAEYEVPTTDTPPPPRPRGLRVVRDVTDEGTFANKRLARLGAEQARDVVRQAYL